VAAGIKGWKGMRKNDESPIDSLKGIGAKTKQTFEKAGIETLEDLIHYYPREYERYEAPVPVMELKEGMYAAVSGRLLAPLQTRYVRGLSITSGLFGDGLENILVSWFNMPYLKNSLRSGVPYIFRGRIKAKGDRFILEGEDELFLSGDNAYRYFRETKGLFAIFLAGIPGKSHPLHHNQFQIDEAVLPCSVEALYEIVKGI